MYVFPDSKPLLYCCLVALLSISPEHRTPGRTLSPRNSEHTPRAPQSYAEIQYYAEKHPRACGQARAFCRPVLAVACVIFKSFRINLRACASTDDRSLVVSVTSWLQSCMGQHLLLGVAGKEANLSSTPSPSAPDTFSKCSRQADLVSSSGSSTQRGQWHECSPFSSRSAPWPLG